MKDSDSESEDAAKSNEMKKKVLANLWRRNPSEASKKKAVAARGKKSQVTKAKVGAISFLIG